VETDAIIGIACGVALIVLVVLGLFLFRRPRKAVCAGCGRAAMPGWTQCMFCGAPIAAGGGAPAGGPKQPPRLEFLGGPLAGQVVQLGADVTTIGSVAGNTVVLSDPAVSRKHVGIRKVGAKFELADLGSTNGVYVNGQRVPKKTLAAGDRVRVGNTELVFHA
jgi:hypothetical protein